MKACFGLVHSPAWYRTFVPYFLSFQRLDLIPRRHRIHLQHCSWHGDSNIVMCDVNKCPPIKCTVIPVYCYISWLCRWKTPCVHVSFVVVQNTSISDCSFSSAISPSVLLRSVLNLHVIFGVYFVYSCVSLKMQYSGVFDPCISTVTTAAAAAAAGAEDDN